MVKIGKPDIRSITITVNDRKAKKSKSVTVYGFNFEEAFKIIEKSFESKKKKD